MADLRVRLQDMAANLRSRIDKCTTRVSKCAETYLEFHALHHEYDAFLVAAEPSNPWISDSTEMWEMYEKCSKEQVEDTHTYYIFLTYSRLRYVLSIS